MEKKILSIPQSLNEVEKFFVYFAVLSSICAACIDIVLIQNKDSFLLMLSQYLRFSRTVSCALIPLTYLFQKSNKYDYWLVLLAMLLCIPADFYLVLRNHLKIGIAIFFFVQVLFIIRHLRSISLSILRFKAVQFSILIALIVFILANVFLFNALAAKGLAIPVLLYSFFLIIACLTAYWQKFSTNSTILLNSNYIFWGLLLFVCCDITVGIGAAFNANFLGQLIRALTSIFYTPSLILLGFSAKNIGNFYNYPK